MIWIRDRDKVAQIAKDLSEHLRTNSMFILGACDNLSYKIPFLEENFYHPKINPRLSWHEDEFCYIKNN